MRILFCYLVVLIVTGSAAYVIGSVVWHVLANLPAAFEDEDEDEDHPYDPDQQRDWEIADEMRAY